MFQPYLIKFICNQSAFTDNELDLKRDERLINAYMVEKTQTHNIVATEGPNPARYRTTAFKVPKKDPDVDEKIILEDCAFEYA